MTSLKIYMLLALGLCLGLTVNAQEGDSDSERDKTEKNTAPFSLNYFNKNNNAYYVITLAFEDNQLKVDENTRIMEVPGKFPYQTGNFNVRVLDQQGEIIADYFMQDPLLVRSCEEEAKNLSYLKKGILQLILPRSNDVAAIELFRNEKMVGKVNIRSVVEKFLKQRDEEGNGNNPNGTGENE